MITTAVIAEFNPFHKGHEYIIERARKDTNADYIVVIMSGNFTQRGEIAIAPKQTRAKAALCAGADIVFELPFVYSTSNAELFALGAVAILSELKCIDYLCFGSEAGDISVLNTYVDVMLDEPAAFKSRLAEALESGMTYPSALSAAFEAVHMPTDILSPNNILAMEYLKAVKKLNSSIIPVTTPRLGQGYSDSSLRDTFFDSSSIDSLSCSKDFISASAFRANLPASDSELKEYCISYLPGCCSDIFISETGRTFPILPDDMMPQLVYSLRINMGNCSATNYIGDFAESTPNIARHIFNLKRQYSYSLTSCGYEDFILKIKTKDVTAAKIGRIMIHMLLGYTKPFQNECADLCTGLRVPYVRLLGFSKNGQALLSELKKKDTDIVIISTLSKDSTLISGIGNQILEFDISASAIYADIVYNKFGYVMPDEFQYKPVIV